TSWEHRSRPVRCSRSSDWLSGIFFFFQAEDGIRDGHVTGVQTCALPIADVNYSGLDPADVSVANADNEGGITVAPTSGLITTEAGGTDTFTIHLNTQPAANVTIGLSSSDLTEGTVSPSSVIFTPSNWNTDQVVTVTGVDD